MSRIELHNTEKFNEVVSGMKGLDADVLKVVEETLKFIVDSNRGGEYSDQEIIMLVYALHGSALGMKNRLKK